jgi:hypothetical protein
MFGKGPAPTNDKSIGESTSNKTVSGKNMFLSTIFLLEKLNINKTKKSSFLP